MQEIALCMNSFHASISLHTLYKIPTIKFNFRSFDTSLASLCCSMFLVVVATLLTIPVVVSGISVGVGIRVEGVSPAGLQCVGGLEGGHYHGYVEMDYRCLKRVSPLPTTADHEEEWVLVTKQIPLSTQYHTESLCDNFSNGIQFRIIQKNHLGGGCSCWEVVKFSVRFGSNVDFTFSNTAGTFSDTTACHSEGEHGRVFCNGNANQPRGVITKAFYFEGSGGVQCPLNSHESLFPEYGPPLPENCDNISPRM